jgi:uncharacterized protein
MHNRTMPTHRECGSSLSARIVELCTLFVFVISMASACAQESHSVDPDLRLFQAVRTHDIQALRRLVSGGASIEAKDSNGDTLLMAAAEGSNIEAVKFLLDKGANVSVRDNQNETALILAATAFDPAVLETLLPRISDDQEKNDALLMAARGRPVVNGMSGPEPDQLTADETADLPWVRSVRLLLDSGANIEATDEEGTTPLLQAAAHAQTEIFKFLLTRGANLKARDKRGWTVLMDAACNCALATMNSAYVIVKILLDLGVNVNARAHDGSTALILASGMVGDATVLKLLLERGANPLLKNDKGETALRIALQGRRDDKVRLLRQAIAKAH